MKKQYVIMLLALCTAFKGYAMDKAHVKEESIAVLPYVQKANLKSVGKQLIALLQTEDAIQIKELLSSLLGQHTLSGSEKMMLFFKHCLFVFATKKQAYSTEALSRRFNPGWHPDPVLFELDGLLGTDIPHMHESAFTNFGLFKYGWERAIQLNNNDLLSLEEAVLLWTIKYRAQLCETIDSAIYCYLMEIFKKKLSMPNTTEQVSLLIRQRLEGIRHGKKSVFVSKNDALSLSLRDMINLMSPNQITYCIFMLIDPALKDRLALWNFFLKIYFKQESQKVNAQDPLVQILLELLTQQLPQKIEDFRSFLHAQTLPEVLSAEQREKFNALKGALSGINDQQTLLQSLQSVPERLWLRVRRTRQV